MADLERGSPPPLFADSDNEGNDDVLNVSNGKIFNIDIQLYVQSESISSCSFYSICPNFQW